MQYSTVKCKKKLYNVVQVVFSTLYNAVRCVCNIPVQRSTVGMQNTVQYRTLGM